MFNFHCFGCGCNIDIIDAYMMSGLTYSEAAQKLFQQTGIVCGFGERGVRTKREYKYPKEVPAGNRDLVDAYFATRKISKNTLDHCDVRQDEYGNAVFNYYDTNDVLTLVKYRPSHKINKSSGDIKTWCQKHADTAPLLFNMNRINTSQPLLITQGQADTLAAIEAGFLNSVSVPFGAQNHHWIEYNLEWLDQFNDIIICSDNDEAGIAMAKAVCPRLGSWRTKVVQIPQQYADENGMLHRIKDLNELLYYGGPKAVMDAIVNAKESQVDSVVDLSSVRDVNIADIDGVYFGLNDLDRQLFKLFYGTLTLVTGKPGCVSADTEFFNGFRWKRIDEYKQGDMVLQYNLDGTASLVKPLQYHKYPCKEFWKLKTYNGAVNQMISDQHNIVYMSKNGGIIKKNILDVLQMHRKSKLGFSGKFITTFRYSGQGIPLSDQQIRVMCAVICDGTFYEMKKGGVQNKLVRLNLKKNRKKQRIRKLLSDAKISWSQHRWNRTDPEYMNFVFQSPIRTRVFDSYWYQCSQHQINVITDQILFWDGHVDKKGRKSFSTTVRQTADFIQFAFSVAGFRSSISTYNRTGQYHSTGEYVYKSVQYQVHISKHSVVGIRSYSKGKLDINKVKSDDGYKYCFSVPSGMLVLRRQNSINITGNSGKTSFLYQILCNALEQRKNIWLFSRELPQYMTKSWMNYLLAGPRNVDPYEGSNGSVYYRLKKQASHQIDQAYRGQWYVYKDEWPNDVETIQASMQASARKYGAKVFLIDNLMMVNLHAGDDNKYDKQTQFVSWLIQFSAKFQVAVILVAHPRKMQASSGAVDLYDIGGSSNLVNLAHRTLSLRRITKEERESGDSEYSAYSCVVSVTKDRMRGRSGFELGLYYDDSSRRFYTNYEQFDRKYRWDPNTYTDRLACKVLDEQDEVFGVQVPAYQQQQ